ncbi:polysaccharide deacetylase family protein [Maritalea porphyrae]|uniref:polysaccharide deacetylase family protein n=1 Tax=Maritalea porphyrae TaxID=880732 RepID=UPI0022B02BE7|nr:polysaccharide deacetylase family protein [Maritalea porphyrae]MCZ4270812.1 polysaccharide deacetylase family protein [Maritalea porphyrae]
MKNLKYRLIHLAMECFALPGVARSIRALSKCKGTIFTMHRVLPGTPAAFSPNGILQITPEFLETVIVGCQKQNIDIVDLDEAMRRLRSKEPEKQFAVFTFDDGYKDNLEFALPILRKHNCPFTLFIAPNLIDAQAEIWWQALEDIIGENDSLEFDLGQGIEYRETATTQSKLDVFDELYWFMREKPEADRLKLLYRLAKRYAFNLSDHCRNLIMDWDELRTFVDEPLCTIGAHTVNHYELNKLPADKMRTEIEDSVKILTLRTGKQPDHFSYPIGGKLSAGPREFAAVRDLGLVTGVTTRPGGLYAENAEHPEALPRISLNGNYQKSRFVDVFLTGAVFTTHSGMKKVNVN